VIVSNYILRVRKLNLVNRKEIDWTFVYFLLNDVKFVSLFVVVLRSVASVHLWSIYMGNKTQISLAIYHAQELIQSRVLSLVNKVLSLGHLESLKLCNSVVEFRHLDVLLKLSRDITSKISHNYTYYVFGHLHQELTCVLHPLNVVFVEAKGLFTREQFLVLLDIDGNHAVSYNLAKVVGTSF
jgi:hypothetical protein